MKNLIKIATFCMLLFMAISCGDKVNPTGQENQKLSVGNSATFSTNDQLLLSEFGGNITDVSPETGWGGWLRIRINIGRGYNCPILKFGFCIIRKATEGDEGPFGQLSIVNNQVAVAFEAPVSIDMTTESGFLAISDDMELDTDICSEFGFSQCVIYQGLYQADFSDPNYPNGVIYFDAYTVQ